MAVSNCNWWQYSRFVRNVGRTARFLAYVPFEREAIIEFLDGMRNSRPEFAYRLDNALGRPDAPHIADERFGLALRKIGATLKVVPPTDEEKAACDELFAATGKRKYRILVAGVAPEKEDPEKKEDPSKPGEDPENPSGEGEAPKTTPENPENPAEDVPGSEPGTDSPDA